MYHLIKFEDKVKALKEAARVTKKGGVILVAYVMNEFSVITYGFKENNIIELIESGSPHSARKTFAVEDAERHGLKHTQRMLQHSSKETTKLYAFSDRYVGAVTDRQMLQTIMQRIENFEDYFDFFLEKLEELEEIVKRSDKSATNENPPLTKGGAE